MTGLWHIHPGRYVGVVPYALACDARGGRRFLGVTDGHARRRALAWLGARNPYPHERPRYRRS